MMSRLTFYKFPFKFNFKSSEKNDIKREIERIFMSTCRKWDTILMALRCFVWITLLEPTRF